MVCEHRSHFGGAEIELHIIQFLKREMCCHLIEPDRKKSALHLLEKSAAQSVDGAFVTKNANIDPRMVGGHKKRKSLDVIPMGVSDQHGDVEARFAHFLHQGLPEPTNSRSGIQNDDLVANANLDT